METSSTVVDAADEGANGAARDALDGRAELGHGRVLEEGAVVAQALVLPHRDQGAPAVVNEFSKTTRMTSAVANSLRTSVGPRPNCSLYTRPISLESCSKHAELRDLGVVDQLTRG